MSEDLDLSKKVKNEIKSHNNDNELDKEKLIQELEVHQIELEHKNQELKRFQNEIIRMRDKYHNLYELAPVGYITFDKEGVIKEINLRGAQLLGLERKFLIDKPFIIYLPPQAQDDFFEHLQQVWQKKSLNSCELTIRKKNSEQSNIYLESSYINFSGEGGRNEYIQSSLTDITSLKENQRELSKLSKALEHSPATVVITNAAGNIEYVNPEFEETTGYKRNFVLNQNLRILKSGEHTADFYKKMWDKILNGESWHGVFRNKKKNGELYWEDASISPVIDSDGNIVNYIKVAKDITREKETEKKLFLYAESLRETNRELEKTTSKLNGRIKKAEEMHQQFLPKNLPQIEGISLASHYQPAQIIGGDFYNVISFENLLILYIVDISGHDIDGALLNIFIRETINSYLLKHHDYKSHLNPAAMIHFIYQKYCDENFSEDYLVCIIIGILDLDNMKFVISNAGIQIPPLYITNNGEIIKYDNANLPISSIFDSEYFAQNKIYEYEVQVEKGAALIISTDGLIEEVSDGAMFGLTRYKDIFSDHHYIAPELLIDVFKKNFRKICGLNQSQDDITMLALRRDLDIIDSFKMKLSSKIESLYIVKHKCQAFLSKYINDINAVCGGILELFSNALEHGNKLDESKMIELDIIITSKYIRITIEDSGQGFVWQDLVMCQKECLEELKKDSERGRGLLIAKKSFDFFWYNNKGNKVYLYKLR
jgi:PAS domain S-box-containing protein